MSSDTAYKVAAVAIENRVDFEAFTATGQRETDHIPLLTSGITRDPGESTPFAFRVTDQTDLIPPAGPRKPPQTDYLGQICRGLENGFRKILLTDGGVAWLNTLDALVISTPGVVEHNRTLVQLPLWSWNTDAHIEWRQGERGFDFRNEIERILSRLSRELQIHPSLKIKEISQRVHVVNDATACAAFYYDFLMSGEERDRRDDGLPDFVYVKFHDGVNVGVVEQGRLFGRRPHPEYGHIYPNLHNLDQGSGFRGTCRYHGRCLEGVLSLRSFLVRAALDREGGKSPTGWEAILNQIEASDTSIEDAQRELFHRLLPDDPDLSDRHAVDLCAHYLAQAIYILMLSPSCPSRIVIGGRFAKPAVMAAVYEKLRALMGHYPDREVFHDLEALVQLAPEVKHLPDSRRKVEVYGASVLAMAYARARQKHPGGMASIDILGNRSESTRVRP